jgi:hypothetical protein
MSDFDLEREVTEMLGNKSASMPSAVDADQQVIGRARSRRRTKLAALGGSSAAAMALVVGLAVVASRDDKEAIRLQPADTTATTELSTSTPDVVVTSSSGPPLTTDPPVAAVLEPGSIVAARDDGIIVELDTAGSEVRELYDAGGEVAEIDVDPDGAGLFVRMASEGNCGEVRRIDLADGATESFGSAEGVALSGDGKVLALSAAGDDPLCPGGSRAVVVRHLGTGAEFAFPDDVDPTFPADAQDLALSFDGSRLAFERCFEGCEVLLADVPVQCLDNSVECDAVEPTKWDDMTKLVTTGNGYAAGTYDPVFQGDLVIASECDCEVEAPSQAWRLVSFDPTNGDRVAQIQDLPEGREAVVTEGSIVLVQVFDGSTRSTLAYTDGEPFTFPGTYTAVALAPVAEE